MSLSRPDGLADVQSVQAGSSKGTKGPGPTLGQQLLGKSLAAQRSKGGPGSKGDPSDPQDGVDLSGGVDYDAGRRGIMQDLLDNALGAGGMASVGALGSILSWANTELENGGQLHPETAAIVRETLARAVEYGLIDEEKAASLSEHYFPQE